MTRQRAIRACPPPRALAWLLVLLAAGCGVGPAYHRPDPGRLPARFAAAAADTGAAATVDSLLARPWWRAYGEAALDSLVREALAGNWDLAAAAARVLQARGQVRSALSPRLPAVEVGGSATRSKMTLSRFGLRGSVYNNLYDVHLGASWELDLWQRLAKGHGAARAGWRAAAAEQRAVRQSVVAQVVRGWLAVGEGDAQARLAARVAAADSALLAIADQRYRDGTVTADQLLSARRAAAASAAAAHDRRRQAADTRRALALLLGRYPAPDGLPAPDLFRLPDLPPVPPGVPVAVLRRRPDVTAAEWRLRAATDRVGMVKAELLPRVVITGQDGYTSTILDQLLTDAASVWNLAASIAMPLLNRGAVTGRKQAAEGERRQAVAAYVQAVLAALRDVESALDADRATHAALTAWRAAADDAAAQRELAEERYRAGLIDAAALWQARRAHWQALSRRLTAELAARAARVDLRLALGGAWDAAVPAADPAVTGHPFAAAAASREKTP